MFIEPILSQKEKRGWIEVITGSMFSGKTEELIRRLRRARIANQQVEIFKPSVDVRYHKEDIVSHNENTIKSTPVQTSGNILMYSGNVDVIGLDEAQFFDDGIVDVAEHLADSGIRVIVAGLDMDFLGKPFGPMPQLLSVAEYITKVHAICVVCGGLATHSFRRTERKERVLLGEKQIYEPRCRICFKEGMEARASS